MLTALPVMFQGDAEAAYPNFVEGGEIGERFGDADLTGTVNLNDFNRLAANFGTTGTGLWSQGDFNYDGVISGDDYSAIDFNILAQGAAL